MSPHKGDAESSSSETSVNKNGRLNGRNKKKQLRKRTDLNGILKELIKHTKQKNEKLEKEMKEEGDNPSSTTKGGHDKGRDSSTSASSGGDNNSSDNKNSSSSSDDDTLYTGAVGILRQGKQKKRVAVPKFRYCIKYREFSEDLTVTKLNDEGIDSCREWVYQQNYKQQGMYKRENELFLIWLIKRHGEQVNNILSAFLGESEKERLDRLTAQAELLEAEKK